MDIREFAKELSDATKEMSDEQRDTVRKMFEQVYDQLDRPLTTKVAATADPTEIPDGPTERHVRLKQNFLKQVPTITTYRARAVTEFTKKNPGMPKILLRAKCFRYCCETAPLVIQDDELIVGSPCGAPRAGAFLPTSPGAGCATRSTPSAVVQHPFFISEEDKKYMREELFPFWEGKSLDEYCEDQYREAGVWGAFRRVLCFRLLLSPGQRRRRLQPGL